MTARIVGRPSGHRGTSAVSQNYDVVVVGTGPGGYVAAIRCAQLGLTVAAVEDDRAGGVCLNWGCIPTKALLRNAEVVGLFHRAQEFGITVAEWSADYAQAVQRSRRVADRMAKGVEFLFRKNKITLYAGVGVLTGRNTVEVKGKDGSQTLEGKAIILATGSEPKSLPGVALDEKQVISSNGAVRSEVRPGSLVVIGAGAVGMEFADVFASYGTTVTVLEALPKGPARRGRGSVGAARAPLHPSRHRHPHGCPGQDRDTWRRRGRRGGGGGGEGGNESLNGYDNDRYPLEKAFHHDGSPSQHFSITPA